MNFEDLRVGYELSAREWNLMKKHLRGTEAKKAVATQKRPMNRGQITQAEVDFMVKCLEAPDVNLFVKMM
jgi:hypothetical protein